MLRADPQQSRPRFIILSGDSRFRLTLRPRAHYAIWEERMRRRELIAGLLLAAAPGWLQAQQTAKVYRIAVVDPGRPIVEMSGGVQGWPEYRAFFEELRRLGYIENQNLLVDRFGAEQHAN